MGHGGTCPPGPSERQNLRQWERPLTFWDIFVFLNSLKVMFIRIFSDCMISYDYLL